ncbi:hypothetical protein AN958_11699 [Leucoagaricus sp. SymC.cos]|nr:hypothetical protein AN958_11699 [Leucoagaricus sp. SymC.cos]
MSPHFAVYNLGKKIRTLYHGNSWETSVPSLNLQGPFQEESQEMKDDLVRALKLYDTWMEQVPPPEFTDPVNLKDDKSRNGDSAGPSHPESGTRSHSPPGPPHHPHPHPRASSRHSSSSKRGSNRGGLVLPGDTVSCVDGGNNMGGGTDDDEEEVDESWLELTERIEAWRNAVVGGKPPCFGDREALEATAIQRAVSGGSSDGSGTLVDPARNGLDKKSGILDDSPITATKGVGDGGGGGEVLWGATDVGLNRKMHEAFAPKIKSHPLSHPEPVSTRLPFATLAFGSSSSVQDVTMTEVSWLPVT